MERVRVIDAVKMLLEYTGHEAEIVFRPDMPTGPPEPGSRQLVSKETAGLRAASALPGWPEAHH